jgi:hypothetical protein
VGGQGGLEGLGALGGGGERPAAGDQGGGRRRWRLGGDGGVPLGQGGGVGRPAQPEVGLDQGGGDPEGSPSDPRPPSAAMRASSSAAVSARSPRHSAQNAAVMAWWAWTLVVPAWSVSALARSKARRASSWRPRAADCQASISTATAVSAA